MFLTMVITMVIINFENEARCYGRQLVDTRKLCSALRTTFLERRDVSAPSPSRICVVSDLILDG